MDVINENSTIGINTSIYQGARVKNSVVADDCIVGSFSRVDESSLHEHCRIDRNNHIFSSQLGRYSYTGMNTVLMHSEIGNFCSISWNVSIGGANHDYERIVQHSFLYNPYDKLRPDPDYICYDRFTAPIKVGHDVWIAAGAVIVRGVTIGSGAVVGANAVVTKDVPPYAIAAGNPAKVIKYRFSPEVISELLRLEWWLWDKETIKKYYHHLSETPSLETLQYLSMETEGVQDSVSAGHHSCTRSRLI